MNIDDLTLGQIKEIQAMTSTPNTQKEGVASHMVGKFVIVRSHNEGVNFGKVLKADDTGVVLECAQRLWYHKPLKKEFSWYEGISLVGPSDDTQVSHPVSEKLIIEDYSMTVCSDVCVEKMAELKPHAQN